MPFLSPNSSKHALKSGIRPNLTLHLTFAFIPIDPLAKNFIHWVYPNQEC